MLDRGTPPPWAKNARTDRDVVVQVAELWCGHACGEMLLSDRGLHVDQATIASRTATPATAERLAAALSALSPFVWLGGNLDPDEPGAGNSGHLQFLCEERGTWAALLMPSGRTHLGHWIVVDGVLDDVLSVRDPVGWRYEMHFDDFIALWPTTALVIRE